jgi:peptidoglycan/LPS O-acetylase OafA/YrhL
LIAITIVGAAVLFHFVEEPTRHWMRRMVDVGGRKADGRADQTARSTNGKLQSVDRGLEARPKSISARAG